MSKFLLSGYWPITLVFECNKYSTQLILKFRKDSRIEYTLLGPPFLPIYVSVTSLRVCGNFQKQKKSLEK